MKFRLVHTEVPFLRLDKNELNDEIQKKGTVLGEDAALKLGLNIFPDSSRQEMFGVLFDIELSQPEDFKLQMHFVAWFESSTPLEEEDINSAFARINAPAIAFPYLRSFISLLTLNSGFRPAILSTVNFIEMYKEFNAQSEKVTDQNKSKVIAPPAPPLKVPVPPASPRTL